MNLIHVVDDDQGLLHALSISLRARGYKVHMSPDGTSGLRQIAQEIPDLVIVDLGLPDIDGLDVVRALRGWLTAPIIVLSAREAQRDKVHALDAGADDYVTKPFGMDELVARIRAALRRTRSPHASAVVYLGSTRVDLGARNAVNGGRSVALSPTEWHLLESLLRNPGQLVSQNQLLTEVWGSGYEGQSNYLRVYMARLRRKLEADPTHPRHLITVAGSGYRYDP